MKKSLSFLLAMSFFVVNAFCQPNLPVGADITLRNTLQNPGEPEATYASLFGQPDDAFDESGTLSNSDSEFPTALAQPSSSTGLPFDIGGLYDIDLTETSIEFKVLPDNTDPFWAPNAFGLFEAGKFDRYYFTFSAPHNIVSAASNHPSVNVRIDSDMVLVVEISEGYNLGAGVSFFISLNMAEDLTNEEKARAFNEGLINGDKSVIKWIHEDYIQHNLGVPTGKAPIAGFYGGQPTGITVDIHRSFEVGDFVFAQTTLGGTWGQFFGSNTDNILYEVWRFEDGFAMEHWDNIVPVLDDMDGTTQTDGAFTPATDLGQTDANKTLLEEMTQTLFIDGDWTNVESYFDIPNFVQHSDGAGPDGAFLASLQGQTGVSFYDEIKFIHVLGNYGLVMSQGPDITGQDPTGVYAYYDLFRIENGIIVEHWDAIQLIPDQSEWAHTNGKWGDDAIQIPVGTNIRLRNTLQNPGESEGTYASLFGQPDDAFDEFATLSNTDIEFATALAQPSAATGLPFDINGLYGIDFTTTSIAFTLLPDASDPFWIQQFEVFPAGKVDRYYFTYSEPHNITNYTSSNSAVNLRIDSDTVIVVEINEGYDFNPGQAFTIDLNPPAVDITLRNTLQNPGAPEGTYASLFGQPDDAFDEFAVLSNLDVEFATALAQPSSATGLPFDISGLYEIDITDNQIAFTLLPDATDPFWIQQFEVFPAGKVDRYYFTYSSPHNITNYTSSNSAVNLRVDSDNVVVVEINEGYDFNPGQAFTIDLNPPAVDITLRNTLQNPGEPEGTYASLFGQPDDAFDEFAVLSNLDVEFATALAQPSAATGLPFDISGLYEIDITDNQIAFTLLPDATDPFWIQQFEVFPAGKVDRYYFTYSAPHNITNYTSSNNAVNLRVDSDNVVVVEINEGYDFNPGQAFTIDLNPPAVDITLRNTLQNPGEPEGTYASLFGQPDDAFDEFAVLSNLDVEFATALAQPSAATGLPFDISGLYEIDITDNQIAFTLLPDATDPFWIQQFEVFPAGKVDRYYFTYSAPHNITSFSSSNNSVNLRIDSDNIVVVEISEGYDFNPGQAFVIDLNPPSSGVDLNLDLAVANQLYDQYTTVDYIFTVTNEGNETATNIEVDATFPSGFVYSTHSTTSGNYELFFNSWAIPSLEPGESAVLNLQLFTLIGGQDITYFAEIVAQDQADADSSPGNGTGTPAEDDEALVTISPKSNGGSGTNMGNNDLELSITADNSNYSIYDVVRYTISVTNNGTAVGTGIVVNAGIPTGMAYVNDATNSGQYKGWLGEWVLDDLEAGQTATLELDLFILVEVANQPVTNFVQIFVANDLDPDSTPGNNSSGVPAEDDEASVTIQVAALLTSPTISQSLNRSTSTPQNGLVNNGKFDVLSSSNFLGATTQISLSPNPFRQITNFEVVVVKEGEYLFQVFDITGKEVSNQMMELNEGNNRFTFEGSHLTKGFYKFTLSNKEGFVSGKMIVVE